MSDALVITSEIHRLFKAFHELDVPHKRDVCEELRVLILDKKVSGRSPISCLASDAGLLKDCSQWLRSAIQSVIRHINPSYTFPAEHDDEHQDYDDEDDDDDEEIDPDYVPPANARRELAARQGRYDKLKSDNMVYVSKNIKEIGDRLEQYARQGAYSEVRFIVKYLEMSAKVLETINDV